MNTNEVGTLNAGYDLTYTYQDSTGHKFLLENVRDVNYRTEGTAGENDKVNNGHRYIYDANGNLVYINTSRVKKDGKEDEKATEQKYRLDEENRLLAADENGFVSNYWYDADGERTVKTSGENEAIYVNSEFSGGNTGTARFSGSFGCFGISSGNSAIKKLISDVVTRQGQNRDKTINITVQKRNNVDWNYVVDSSGNKTTVCL